jgi:hypothetical protein
MTDATTADTAKPANPAKVLARMPDLFLRLGGLIAFADELLNEGEESTGLDHRTLADMREGLEQFESGLREYHDNQVEAMEG